MIEAILTLILVFEGTALTGKAAEQGVTQYYSTLHAPTIEMRNQSKWPELYQKQLNAYNQFIETHEQVNGTWIAK